MDASVNLPSANCRCLAEHLAACSALALFHGTPSWSRKVNSLPRYFSSRFW
jgi:hypothetical protein